MVVQDPEGDPYYIVPLPTPYTLDQLRRIEAGCRLLERFVTHHESGLQAEVIARGRELPRLRRALHIVICHDEVGEMPLAPWANPTAGAIIPIRAVDQEASGEDKIVQVAADE